MSSRKPRRKRTAARAPAGRVQRPHELGSDGLAVTMRAEDGETKTFDFRHLLTPPTPLLLALVAAFARCCGPLGGWRRVASAENGETVLRRFVRYLAEIYPDVTAIESVTPAIWLEWRNLLEEGTKHPSQIVASRKLLLDAEGLPRDTRRALMRRVGRSPRRKTASYSRNEVARIVWAARRVFREARRRIAANEERLQRYRDGDEPNDCWRLRLRGQEWTPGWILDCLSRTGRMPASYKYLSAEQGRVLRDELGIDAGSRHYRPALFPASYEIYAAMLLLVYERGFNVSVLANLRVSEEDVRAARRSRHHPVRTETDKPRRGGRRYSGLTLVGREATLWDRLVNLTQHTRETSARRGHETDRLLVGCVRGSRAAGPEGIFITNFRKSEAAAYAWRDEVTVIGDDGARLAVNPKRLRLSEQVINGEARENSASVSESTYRLPDPRTAERARPVILQAQWDGVQDASRTVAKLMTAEELVAALDDPRQFAATFGISEELAREVLTKLPEGQLDTATCACVDFMHSPHEGDNGGPCTAGFLMCLSCPRAVMTAAHLPRLLALREALVAAGRASSPAVRNSRYREPLAALDHALSQFPREAVEVSSTEVQPEVVDQIMRLLSGGFDR